MKNNVAELNELKELILIKKVLQKEISRLQFENDVL